MKKKILAIAPIYYPHAGGIERAIFELYSRIPFEVDLLVPNFGGPSIEKQNNLTIHRVCKPATNKIMKLFKYQWFQYKKAKELLKKHSYACIHSHSLVPTYFVCNSLQRKFDIPWILTEHHFGTGMDISTVSGNPQFITTMMKSWVHAPAKIITTGKTQTDFISFLGRTDSIPIHLGGTEYKTKLTKKQCREKLNLPCNTNIAFTIGRLVKRKRVDLLINTFKKSSWIIVIGGMGPLYKQLKKQESSAIIIKGFISEEELAMYYKAADVFITASEFEGAGITYMDAFASKTPLLAFENDASADLVKENTGMLFKSAAELQKIISKKQINVDIKKAYDLYKNHYNWKRYAKEYTNIFQYYNNTMKSKSNIQKKQKTKVLILFQDWGNWFETNYSRFEFWFKYMDGAYDKNNEYVILALSQKSGTLKPEKNIRVHLFKTTPIMQLITLRLFSKEVRKQILQFKPDYIYSPFIYMLSTIPKWYSGKVIGFVRDKTAEMVKAKGGLRAIVGNIFYYWDKKAFSRIDIICHNGRSMENYARKCGFTGPAHYCPRPIVDKSEYKNAKPISKWKNKKIILSVARLTQEKNIQLGIKALASLPKQFEYVIVGEGEYKKELIHLAKQVGVEKRIHFQGFIQHKDIWQYYKRADFFWLLSKTDFEGTPNALVEAVYANCNIIVSPIEAMKNIISDESMILNSFKEKELAHKTMHYNGNIQLQKKTMLKQINKRMPVKKLFN